jgi:hypothetical protein
MIKSGKRSRHGLFQGTFLMFLVNGKNQLNKPIFEPYICYFE